MTEQRAGPGLEMGRDLPLVLRQTWQPALLPEVPAVYTHSSGMLFNRKKKRVNLHFSHLKAEEIPAKLSRYRYGKILESECRDKLHRLVIHFWP